MACEGERSLLRLPRLTAVFKASHLQTSSTCARQPRRFFMASMTAFLIRRARPQPAPSDPRFAVEYREVYMAGADVGTSGSIENLKLTGPEFLCSSRPASWQWPPTICPERFCLLGRHPIRRQAQPFRPSREHFDTRSRS